MVDRIFFLGYSILFSFIYCTMDFDIFESVQEVYDVETTMYNIEQPSYFGTNLLLALKMPGQKLI